MAGRSASSMSFLRTLESRVGARKGLDLRALWHSFGRAVGKMATAWGSHSFKTGGRGRAWIAAFTLLSTHILSENSRKGVLTTILHLKISPILALTTWLTTLKRFLKSLDLIKPLLEVSNSTNALVLQSLPLQPIT